MSRVIVPNLGFEAELFGSPRNQAIARQEARFAHILRLVEGWEDAAVHPASGAEALAWGMSSRAAELAGAAAVDWPSHAVVKRVNDKRFSHEIASDLHVSLEGSEVATSVEQLSAISERLDVVAKHPFGVAGRGILRVRSSSPKALRRLLASTSVVVEPWVEIEREISGQFDCTSEGVTLIGFTGLLTLPNGQFAGNTTRVEVPATARETMQAAAQRVWREGYRGPMGIDGYVGTLNGEEVVVPVSEINARWTFGRLTLELSRWADQEIAWHHPPRSQAAAVDLPPAVSGQVERSRLPEHCDPEGRSGTYIEGI